MSTSLIFTILLAVHIVLALFLIGIILIQQGKGATAGAAFGSGASSTVFGARGSASFLTRATAILATLFLANSLLLAWLYGRSLEQTSLLDEVSLPTPAEVGEMAPPPEIPAELPASVPSDVPAADVPEVDVPVVPAQ
ncbi:MAG: preprotein translocase subunit SecG [Gammaproteobacteria bacterium]